MKFSEIPQLVYVNSPTYVGLDGLSDQLERWEKSYGLDLNPDFQRGHVWTEKEQVKFVEYLAKGGKFPPLVFNSPEYGGNIRDKNSDLDSKIVLVDGKQRLTAVTRFAAGYIAIFGGKFIHDFEDYKLFLRRTDVLYTVNKLQTRKELLTWYLEINEGQIAHTAEEIERVKNLLKEAQ